MPLTVVKLNPGMQKDETPLAAEGSWIDGNLVRFVRGKPQTIGGWDQVTDQTYIGAPRGGHAWSDISGRRYLAWGTDTRLFAFTGGGISNITPFHDAGVLTNAIAVTNGSAIASITHAAHSLVTGQIVTLSNQIGTLGGVNVGGTYAVTVTDADHYTITLSSAATSTASGGGNLDYKYALRPGLVDGTGEAGGYGTNTYSQGGYGQTNASEALPRVWSLDNFGENLVAVPRGGSLYEFQPAVSYPEMVTNGTFASSAGWVLGTGWSISAGRARVVTASAASDLVQTIPLVAGKMYRLQFTVESTAGSVYFKTDADTQGYASTPILGSGVYDRYFRASAGSNAIIFSKDASFEGSVYNIQLSVASIAYRVKEAPPVNDAVFVDPNRIVVLIGTSAYGGSYNQLTVRWSDQENLTQWKPTTTNLSGDFILAQGGRAVSGLATRQQNLIWTDSALYTMQFTGDASSVFAFRLAGTGCGLAGALAKTEHNGVAYWMSKDNFFMFTGSAPQEIPCSVRRDVVSNIYPLQQEKIACGINPSFSEVWWFYPDQRDALGAECSRYALFNWQEGAWSTGKLARTTWIKPGIFDYPILFGDGRVYFHEKGQSALGAAMSAYLESAYFDIEDGDALSMVRRIVPDFDDQSGAISFTIYTRMFPNGTETTHGPYTATSNTLKLDMRVTARQMKLKLSSNDTPLFWRLGALRIDAMPTGSRR